MRRRARSSRESHEIRRYVSTWGSGASVAILGECAGRNGRNGSRRPPPSSPQSRNERASRAARPVRTMNVHALLPPCAAPSIRVCAADADPRTRLYRGGGTGAARGRTAKRLRATHARIGSSIRLGLSPNATPPPVATRESWREAAAPGSPLCRTALGQPSESDRRENASHISSAQRSRIL